MLFAVFGISGVLTEAGTIHVSPTKSQEQKTAPIFPHIRVHEQFLYF
jgi:hypothetical protein